MTTTKYYHCNSLLVPSSITTDHYSYNSVHFVLSSHDFLCHILLQLSVHKAQPCGFLHSTSIETS